MVDEAVHTMTYDEVSYLDGFIILALSTPFYFFFDYFDQPFRGFIAALSAGVVMSVFRLLRSLSTKPEFWVAICVIAILHIILVSVLPYTGDFRFGFALFPIVVLDIYASARVVLFICGSGDSR